MTELDDKNKAALKRIQKLSRTYYTLYKTIEELKNKRDSVLSDFHAELRCFPDARHAYYHKINNGDNNNDKR